jgi:hypothetical protein
MPTINIYHTLPTDKKPPRTPCEVHRLVDQLLAAQPPEPEQPTAHTSKNEWSGARLRKQSCDKRITHQQWRTALPCALNCTTTHYIFLSDKALASLLGRATRNRLSRVNMSQYRIFTIGPNGHFISGMAFECLNDGQAIEEARRLLDGHDLELWQGQRFVITLKHKEPEACSGSAEVTSFDGLRLLARLSP